MNADAEHQADYVYLEDSQYVLVHLYDETQVPIKTYLFFISEV